MSKTSALKPPEDGIVATSVEDDEKAGYGLATKHVVADSPEPTGMAERRRSPLPSSGKEKERLSSEPRTMRGVPPAGERPEVVVTPDVVIDTRQPPFALFTFAFLCVAVGALLLMHSVSWLATGLGGSERYATLVVGGIQVIVGLMLLAGARWAFRGIQILIPANFVASIVLYAMRPAASLLLVMGVFGFATFVLYGPGRFARASRTRIQVWAGRRAERQPAEDRASPVVTASRLEVRVPAHPEWSR